MLSKQITTSDQKQSSADGSTIHAPAITLPQDGGTIRGIKEKLGTNPMTGTVSMSMPILTMPGHSDFSRQLSLAYVQAQAGT